MPSIWRGRVAVVREYSRRRPARMYLSSSGGTHSQRLAAGRLEEVASLDRRGQRVAYRTISLVDFCARSDVSTVSDAAFKTHISVVEPRHNPSVVAVSCNNDSRRAHLAGGVWAGSRLIYSADRGRNYDVGALVARSVDGTNTHIARLLSAP